MDKFDRKRPRADIGMPVAHDGLDFAHVEAIAHRVAELLSAEARESVDRRLVDAATLATELGVERSWVYEHANELHAIRLGTGPKARLRFDAQIVRSTFVARSIAEQPSHELVNRGSRQPSLQRDRRRASRSSEPGRVLAVRPRGET